MVVEGLDSCYSRTMNANSDFGWRIATSPGHLAVKFVLSLLSSRYADAFHNQIEHRRNYARETAQITELMHYGNAGERRLIEHIRWKVVIRNVRCRNIQARIGERTAADQRGSRRHDSKCDQGSREVGPSIRHCQTHNEHGKANEDPHPPRRPPTDRCSANSIVILRRDIECPEFERVKVIRRNSKRDLIVQRAVQPGKNATRDQEQGKHDELDYCAWHSPPDL
jgi:hypothetical protein